MPPLPPRFFLAASVALLSPLARAQNSSSTFYGISKQLNYLQTSTAATVLDPAEAGLFGVNLPNDIAGSFRTPAGVTTPITAGNEFQRHFPTRAAMDTAFPDGSYTLTFSGTTGIAFALTSNYPTDIPRVTNGTWTQNRLVVDPTKDYTVQFNTFTGWGTVLLVTLRPGSYTAQVSGLNLSTGVALVEVYEVP